MATASRAKQSETVRNEIAGAAAKLFFSKGYEGTTVRDIAQASGASVGSIYHFFANKEGVFVHLIREVFAMSTVATEHWMADETDVRVRMGFQMSTQVVLISSSDRLAQFYELALHSRPTAVVTQALAMQRHLALFPHLAQDEAGLREAAGVCMVINGVIGALVHERLSTHKLDTMTAVRWLLRAVLPLVDPRPEQVPLVSARVEALLEKWTPDLVASVGLLVGTLDSLPSPE